MKRSHISFALVMAVTHRAAAQAPVPAPTSKPSSAPTAPESITPAFLENRAQGDLATQGEQRGRAELAFQRKSIHFRYFGPRIGWVPLQGDLDHVLGTEQFLITVGRPDLVGQYTDLHPAGFAILGVSAVTLVAASIALINHLDTPDCSSYFGNFGGFSMCVTNNANNASPASNAPMLVLGGASIVGIIVGLVYATPQVLDDNEARNLADAYNQHLRRQLGLPTATATNQPWLHDVKLAPYVARSDAGLALSARF